jgi:hypothetical protein
VGGHAAGSHRRRVELRGGGPAALGHVGRLVGEGGEEITHHVEPVAIGQPARRQEPAHPPGDGGVGRPGELPLAAGGTDLSGLGVDGDQRGQVVEGLTGRADQEEPDHPEQRAHRQAQQLERQVATGRVGQQRVEGRPTLLVVRVPAGQGRPAYAAMGGLGVEDDGGRDHQRGVAGGRDPPAEVDVVAEDRELVVEAAELLEHRAPHQHAGGVDGQDLAHVVVLPLVVLAPLEPELAAAGARDGDADLEQPAQRRPLPQLRTEHVDLRVLLRGREQRRQGPWVGVRVVVQQPDPLRRVGQGAEPVQAHLHGRRERGPTGCAQRLIEGRRQQVRALVAARGVHGDHRPRSDGLGPESLDHRGQPPGAVVADEQHGDGPGGRRRPWGRHGLGHDRQP